MTYNDLISSNILIETFELIDNSIKIFAYLKENRDYIKYNLTDKDFIDLSFLLSVLTNNHFSDVKNILERNDVTATNVGNYFNIDIKDMVNSDNDISLEFDIIFDKCFKDFFNNLLKYLKVTIDELHPNDIISDVTWNIYINGFINNNISKEKQENLYNSLDEGMYERLVKESKSKKIFKVNDYIEKKEKREISSKENYFELRKYGIFLEEKEYLKNPAIGREVEIKKMILTLLTPDKSCILVGKAGVGKTALVEGLSYLIKNNQVPKLLNDKKIISINMNSLISGCIYRGEFEERVEKILNFIKNHKEVILFIDEIHTVKGTGKGKDGTLDMLNILKSYLDRGDIKVIGSTTDIEYNDLLDDPAFRRRFEKTEIKELDNNKIKLILLEEINKLESIYNISFDFDQNKKNIIIDILISLTNEKNKTYNDKINNPDLVLSILKKAFVCAIYYDRDKVVIDDLKEAINLCDRVYESVKAREIIKLENLKDKKELVYRKIIKFPDNYS